MIDVTNLSNESDGDAVADVRIRASEGNSEILVRATLLDCWFDGIVETLRRLASSGGRTEIDLVDEPLPLIATVSDQNLTLEYGQQRAFLGRFSKAREEMVADITAILPEVERRSESPGLMRLIREGIALLAQVDQPVDESAGQGDSCTLTADSARISLSDVRDRSSDELLEH